MISPLTPYLPRVLLALSLSFIAAGVAAEEQQAPAAFTVRIPVATAEHPPTTTAHNFGSVIQGSVPRQRFTFTNRSSKPTQIGAVLAGGHALVLDNSCQGTLSPWASCQMTLGLNVLALGINEGRVTVAHSEGRAVDVFALSATGVARSEVLAFDEVTVNYGLQTIRVERAVRTLTLRNLGEEPAQITDIRLSRNAPAFSVEEHDCSQLLPQQACQVQVRFAPTMLGAVSVGLLAELEDGSRIPGPTLNGTGVQGIPSWSVETLTFDGVSLGEESVRPLTLTNTGQGKLFLEGFRFVVTKGDGFSLKTSSCGAQLLPSQSCQLQVAYLSESTDVQSGYLELRSSGTLSTTSRLKLFAQSQLMQGILSMEPAQLNFGSQSVGQSRVLALKVRSVGQKAVTVSAYELGGAHRAEFEILNAGTCVGTLHAGMECELSVRATPAAVGLRQASLTPVHNASAPVPPVPLTAQGLAGVLNVSPVVLNFPATQTGESASLNVRLQNAGEVPVLVGSLNRAGSSAFTLASACAGQLLAPSAFCDVSVSFAPASTGTHTGTLTVNSNASQPQISVSLSGTASAPPVPVAVLSAFTCPSPGQAPSVTCTATLSNAGTTAFAVQGPGTTNNARSSAQLVGCTSPLSTFAPGATCQVQVATSFTTTPASLAVTYSVVAAGTTHSQSFTVLADVPRLSLAAQPHGSVLVGQAQTAVHTVTNTGAFDATLSATPFVLTGSQAAEFRVLGHTCPAVLQRSATCTVTTECRPLSAGSKAASLAITPSAGATASAPLSCAASAPVPALNVQPQPAVLDLGARPAPVLNPQNSPLTALRLNNLGTGPVTVSRVEVVGPQAAEFAVFNRSPALAGNPVCIGSTMAASSGWCELVVRPSLQATGLRSATLRVYFDGYAELVTVQLQATGVGPVLTVLPATLNVVDATVGSTKTGTVQLRNDSALPLYFESNPVLTSGATVGFSNPILLANPTACPTTGLAVGASCTLQVALTPTSLGGLSGNVRMQVGVVQSGVRSALATANVPLSANAALAPAPLAQFSITPHGSVTVGDARTASHTLTNIGNAPLSFSGATWAISPLVYRIVSNTCTSTAMAPGASCVITTECRPTAAGAVNGTLSMTAGSNLAQRPSVGLTCQGSATAPLASGLTLSPASHDFGPLLVNSTSTARSFTLTNNNPVTSSPVTGLSLSLGGSHAADFSVTSNTCSSLTAGQSCTFSIAARPSVSGLRQAQVAVQSTATGTAPVGVLSVTGGTPSLTVSPSSVTFATVMQGAAAVSTTLTVRNGGTVSAVLANAGSWNITAHALTLSGTCSNNLTLAAGASCTRIITRPVTAPAGTHSLTLNFALASGQGSAAVPVSYTVTPAPTPQGRLDLSCPAQASTGVVGGCTVRWTSTGTTALPTTGMVLNAYARVAPSTALAVTRGAPTCVNGTATSINPGGYCQYALSFNAAQGGWYDFKINAPHSAEVQTAIQVQGPDLRLFLTAHPLTQIGLTSTASHTLTNQGAAPALINLYQSSQPHVTVAAGTCVNATLASGQSCTFTTTCRPTATASVTSTLTLGNSTQTAHRTSGNLECRGQAPVIDAVYENPVLERTGGHTNSGSWVRLTNRGSGPVTLGAPVAATGRSLAAPSGTAGACALGTILQPAQSCVMLDFLMNQAPGMLVEGVHRIRLNNAVDYTWAATPVRTQGLRVAPLATWPAQAQHGAVLEGTLRVTNEAPQPLALPVEFNGMGLTVVSHDCSALLAPNASCHAQVRATAPLTGTTMNLTLWPNSAYEPLIGGVLRTGSTLTRHALGSWSHSVQLLAPRLVMTTTENAPLIPGQSAMITQTLSNDGHGSVTVTGAPRLSNVNGFEVVGTTCTEGRLLAPGASCTINTRFAPAQFGSHTTIVTVPTSVSNSSLMVTGRMVPATDIQVHLSSPSHLMANVASAHTVTLTNRTVQAAVVNLNTALQNQAGGQSRWTGLQAGICGAWTIAPNGAATRTAAPVASSIGSCTVGANPLQPTIRLSGNSSVSLTYDINSGPTLGSHLVSANAPLSPDGVLDSDTSNNTATRTTQVTLPLADLAVTTTPLPAYGPPGRTGVLEVKLRNLAPTTANIPVVTAGIAFSQVQGMTLGAIRCVSASTGANCSGQLPAGAELNYTVPYTIGSPGDGWARATLSVAQNSATTTDPNLANNTVALSYYTGSVLSSAVTSCPSTLVFGRNTTCTVELTAGPVDVDLTDIELERWVDGTRIHALERYRPNPNPHSLVEAPGPNPRARKIPANTTVPIRIHVRYNTSMFPTWVPEYLMFRAHRTWRAPGYYDMGANTTYYQGGLHEFRMRFKTGEQVIAARTVSLTITPNDVQVTLSRTEAGPGETIDVQVTNRSASTMQFRRSSDGRGFSGYNRQANCDRHMVEAYWSALVPRTIARDGFTSGLIAGQATSNGGEFIERGSWFLPIDTAASSIVTTRGNGIAPGQTQNLRFMCPTTEGYLQGRVTFYLVKPTDQERWAYTDCQWNSIYRYPTAGPYTFPHHHRTVVESPPFICRGRPEPRLSLTPTSALASHVAIDSQSGNWWTLRNNESSSVTVTGLVGTTSPTLTGTVSLTASSSDPAQCFVGKVLPPGGQCQVLETVLFGPNTLRGAFLPRGQAPSFRKPFIGLETDPAWTLFNFADSGSWRLAFVPNGPAIATEPHDIFPRGGSPDSYERWPDTVSNEGALVRTSVGPVLLPRHEYGVRGLSLRREGPTTAVVPGEPFTQAYRLTNESSSVYSNIVVPSSVQGESVSSNCSTLQPGQSCVFTYRTVNSFNSLSGGVAVPPEGLLVTAGVPVTFSVQRVFNNQGTNQHVTGSAWFVEHRRAFWRQMTSETLQAHGPASQENPSQGLTRIINRSISSVLIKSVSEMFPACLRVTTHNCPAVLAPGQSCEVATEYTPYNETVVVPAQGVFTRNACDDFTRSSILVTATTHEMSTAPREFRFPIQPTGATGWGGAPGARNPAFPVGRVWSFRPGS